MSTHWNASLSLGLGSINLVVTPLRSAAKGDSISFNLIHEPCGSQIKSPRVCPECDRAVGPEELVKGYQYSKGKFVLFSEEELRSATPERSPEITITKFVPYASLLPDFYDKGYWLTPEDLPSQRRDYAVIWRALSGNAQVGIGSTTITGKQHACAIVPNESALRMYTLVDGKELQPVPVFSLPPIEKGDLEIAKQALATRSGQLEHADLRTEQTDAFRMLVDAKLAGVEYKPTPELPVAPAPDLMEVLRGMVAKPKRKKAARKEQVFLK